MQDSGVREKEEMNRQRDRERAETHRWRQLDPLGV